MALGFSYKHVQHAKKDKKNIVNRYVIHCADNNVLVGDAADFIGITRQAFWLLITGKSKPSKRTEDAIKKVLG